ncbi:MAG: hypothetical protein ACM3ZR_00015 [Pseudomonadota bacterium]
MDGLFVIIAIIIGIANFAEKQKKKQTRMNRQYAPPGQRPVQRRNNIPEPLRKVMAEMEKSWNESQEGAAGDTVEPEATYNETEGIEEEDRSRTGSLSYVEQSRSSEGECDEHKEHYENKAGAYSAADGLRPASEHEGLVFDITEEDLMRSIVMSEILGPPRALKKRIR